MAIDFKSQPKSAGMNKKHHLECIVCGNSFGTHYDETLKSYPHFHPHDHNSECNCYEQYYSTLFNVYQFILDQEHSVTIKQFMDEFDWGFEFSKKKLFVIWSLSVGFLQADHFKRLEVPELVSAAMDTVEDQLAEPKYLDEFLRKNKQLLPPVEPERMPFKAEQFGSKSRRMMTS